MLRDEPAQPVEDVVQSAQRRLRRRVVEAVDELCAESGVLGIHGPHGHLTAVCQRHEHRPAVVGVRLAACEAGGLESIDEGRDIARRDAERRCQLRLGARTLVEDEPEDVGACAASCRPIRQVRRDN